MNRIKGSLSIMRKELAGFFASPIAYIVITIFLIFTGFFFFKDFFYFNQAEMRSLFQLLPLMFTFVIPAVTMGLFAEEKRSGSIEILLTMPLKTGEIVMGKFLAALAFICFMLAPTLIYLITVLINGSPDMGPVIGGYLGAILLAGVYVAIGLFTSALSKNQIVAFITAWALSFSLWLIDKIGIFLPDWMGFIEYLGTDFHFMNISRGILDSRDLVYFVSAALVFFLITVKFIDERR